MSDYTDLGDGIHAYRGMMPKAAMEVAGAPRVVLTDPPYARAGGQHVGRKSGLSSGESDQFWSGWFATIWRHVAARVDPAGCGFVFCDVRTARALEDAVEDSETGWKASQFLVWDRETIGLGMPFRAQFEMLAFVRGPEFEWEGRRDMGTVIRHRWPYGRHANHPSEKPVELLERLLGMLPEGDVFDPFMGSGSTLVAARRVGRGAIGIEANPAHYATACSRVREPIAGMLA